MSSKQIEQIFIDSSLTISLSTVERPVVDKYACYILITVCCESSEKLYTASGYAICNRNYGTNYYQLTYFIVNVSFIVMNSYPTNCIQHILLRGNYKPEGQGYVLLPSFCTSIYNR